MKIYVVAFAFIVLDYFTGLCKSFATTTFQSKVMREGLWHKIALILFMFLGFMADYAQQSFGIGLQAPVGIAICVYIITMELFSSIENLCKINPELMPDKLMQMFGGLHFEERNDHNNVKGD